LTVALLSGGDEAGANCSTLWGDVIVVNVLGTSNGCDGGEKSEFLEEHFGQVVHSSAKKRL
jgi:hypothetical protein